MSSQDNEFNLRKKEETSEYSVSTIRDYSKIATKPISTKTIKKAGDFGYYLKNDDDTITFSHDASALKIKRREEGGLIFDYFKRPEDKPIKTKDSGLEADKPTSSSQSNRFK
ncbi:MAG TPA: hypothetical protein VHE99_11675 [Gammaproteobacteria bacterium]|nr:hypothetical protein [Gammaproteobacteria bacterium]